MSFFVSPFNPKEKFHFSVSIVPFKIIYLKLFFNDYFPYENMIITASQRKRFIFISLRLLYYVNKKSYVKRKREREVSILVLLVRYIVEQFQPDLNTKTLSSFIKKKRKLNVIHFFSLCINMHFRFGFITFMTKKYVYNL